MAEKITLEKLKRAIDFTLLAPQASHKDYEVFFQKAKKYGFERVFVSPYMVSQAVKELEGVIVGTTSGFPHGTDTIESKFSSAKLSVESGALEIDFVMNIGKAIDGDFSYLKREFERMAALKEEVKDERFNVKVILETGYLSPNTIRDLVRLAADTGMDFVKTSTGFGVRGATVEDVIIMRKAASGSLKIKASGGIRTLKQATDLIVAGADRIGTSAGDQILLEAAAILTE